MTQFKRPVAGEPAELLVSAAFQSAVVDVVNAYQRGELTQKPQDLRKQTAVMLKNTTDNDILPGQALSVDQTIPSASTGQLLVSYLKSPLVYGAAIAWHSNIAEFAIATETIQAGLIGPASFKPWGRIKADINGAGDWLMHDPATPAQFKRSTGGVARVITADAATGEVVANFDEQQRLWRYELTADVSNLVGVGNLIDLGGNVYATNTSFRFTNSTKVAGDAGFCIHTGNYFDAIESAATVASAPTPRVRFRLKTNFNDTGVATAYVLDVFGNVTKPDGSPVALGDILTVHDPRKCFAHAVGADTLAAIHADADAFFPAGGSIGYAVKTAQLKASPSDPDDGQYPRWEVEQCTQTVQRMKVKIDSNENIGAVNTTQPTGELGEGTKRLFFNASEAILSRWPDVDYAPEWVGIPGESAYGWYLEATNPHRFSAGDGWAIIERVVDYSRVEDASNVDTPYTANTTGTPEWQIVEVEKPIARWLCATWVISGDIGQWEMSDGPATVFEGENPVFVNYFTDNDQLTEAIETADCLQVDCLKADSKGIAFWDPNSQKYKIVSTDSALYGKASLLEVVGQMDPNGGNDDPLIKFGNPAAGDDPCDLRYVKTEPVRVFGGHDSCPAIKNEIVVPSNMVAVDVVSNVVRNGEELCFTYDTLYVCRTDTGVSDDCLNVCCPETPGCCEYPPENYTNGVLKSACDLQGGVWTPGPCPSVCCDGISFMTDVTDAFFNFTGVQGDTTEGSFIVGSSSTSLTGECGITITFSVLWSNGTCQVQQATMATAELKKNGTCCYWEVTLTQPDEPCTNPLLGNLGDSWPGDVVKIVGCSGTGEFDQDCSTFTGDCAEACDNGGFNSVQLTVDNIGGCQE